MIASSCACVLGHTEVKSSKKCRRAADSSADSSHLASLIGDILGSTEGREFSAAVADTGMLWH